MIIGSKSKMDEFEKKFIKGIYTPFQEDPTSPPVKKGILILHLLSMKYKPNIITAKKTKPPQERTAKKTKQPQEKTKNGKLRSLPHIHLHVFYNRESGWKDNYHIRHTTNQ